MNRKPIETDAFLLQTCRAWSTDWFILTAGDFATGEFNFMTVAWGSFGVMWARPMAHVVVRPSRYTYTFIERYDTFTLSAFPKTLKPALSLCGAKSGRDIDKVKESGLTPVASSQAAAPGFAEAELIVECRKIYAHDFQPSRFMADFIEPCYNGRDYHRSYYGEILAIHGTDAYASI